MGSAVAKEDVTHLRQRNKTIFIKLLNHVQWLTFSSEISTQDLHDQLAALCGQPPGATIILWDRYGVNIPVTPTMRTNTVRDAFIVETPASELSMALRKRVKKGSVTDGDVPAT